LPEGHFSDRDIDRRTNAATANRNPQLGGGIAEMNYGNPFRKSARLFMDEVYFDWQRMTLR
jgi:hypothetical protein